MCVQKSNYQILLNSGITISLDEAHQHLTYLGLLEGLPNRIVNDQIFSNIKSYVKEKIWCSTKPYIIKPKEIMIKISKKRKEYYESLGDNFVPKSLPKIMCVAHFSSIPISDNFMFSQLSMVWFQDNWIMPIDQNIMKKIKSLDWKKYAEQGDF